MLEQELMKAIEANLPKMVGDALKKRIEELEKKAEAYEIEKARAKKYEDMANDLLSQQTQWGDVLKSKAALDAREYEVKLRETVVKLREEHADTRTKEMKEVVLAVFANSRFKYSESVSDNNPMNTQYGVAFNQRNVSRIAEGES